MTYEYDTRGVLLEDKWTLAQIDRMKAGGNAKCREFFEGNGQPWKSLPITEKYNTHVADMYREKLLADAEGRPWIPSDPSAPSSSSSSSTLRKPRSINFASSSSSTPSRTGSPATPSGMPSKAQNEDFFTRMGATNDSRPDNLPPSQGGKYQGFGSSGSYTPSSAGRGNANPLSSRNLPGFDDLRDDPVGALGKGWGFLGAALGAVGKTVNESVLQPTLERAADPALQSQLSTISSRAISTLSTAAKTSGQLLSTGLETSSTFIRRDLGVDVGDLGARYIDRATGRGAGEGYGSVGEEHAPTAHSTMEPGQGDFFEAHLGTGSAAGASSDIRDMPTVRSTSAAGSTGRSSPVTQTPPPPKPEVTGSWDSIAPQAAARRAQQHKEKEAAAAAAPQRTKEEDEWESW
ncbi:ADP-ribosylation factor GTPase-activating protein gcs1 [Rhodotorula toruloides]